MREFMPGAYLYPGRKETDRIIWARTTVRDIQSYRLGMGWKREHWVSCRQRIASRRDSGKDLKRYGGDCQIQGDKSYEIAECVRRAAVPEARETVVQANGLVPTVPTHQDKTSGNTSIALVRKPVRLGAAPKPKQRMDAFGTALRASFETVKYTKIVLQILKGFPQDPTVSGSQRGTEIN